MSHIYTKTFFCCIETVANNALICWWTVVFDWLWANVAPTLNAAFSLTNVHAKWWIHRLLISSIPLLSHATLIYNQSKWVFWGFSGTTAKFGWPGRSALFMSVQLCLKSAYYFLTVFSNEAESKLYLSSHCFAWIVFFSHQKAMLYQHMKFWFFHCFENLQQWLHLITVVCKLIIQLGSNFNTCHLKVSTL